MAIALDTNVLVRYIVQDDQAQADIATQLIDQYAGQKQSIMLNNIVLCELIWVLERGYKYSKADISTTLRHILSSTEFYFENQDILWLSLADYETTSCDFSDSLIGKLNHTKFHCDKTITFDKGTSKLLEFEIL